MEKQPGTRIVMIGAGNVASHLSVALKRSGNQIVQVFSRTMKAAKELADKVNARPSDQISELTDECDLYIFSVSDTVLPQLAKQMRIGSTLTVHTSGSIGMDVFEDLATNYGVIYPLQTFSRDRSIDFKKVPLMVEGRDKENENRLMNLCKQLSDNVLRLGSEDRQFLHLAAVFSCNFTNHLYHLASEILERKGIPFEVLIPLLTETAEKVKSIPPAMAQTGPAIRNDQNVIKKHLDLLSFSPGSMELYEKLSRSIYHHSHIE
jgi:predicted short-subunit dehydrogenase-like oxidoreductase (DUF2520 family)